jgi:shikimate kinase / 3-dehydroquinate synthase
MITWLVGPSGAGKTTVGRRLAEMRGEPFFDIDAMIEERSGRTIDQIFASDGESAFRRLEWNEILELSAMREPCIVALGAGAVSEIDVRHLVRETGVRVFLDIDHITATSRLEYDRARPLLAGDAARSTWQRMYARRHGSYSEADITVDARGSVDDVAIAIDHELATIDRPLWSVDATIAGQRTTVSSYRSLLYLLKALKAAIGTRRVAVICDHSVAAELGELLSDRERGLGGFMAIEGGEATKSFATVERLARAFASLGLTRDDVAVAIGGGVITDVVGFAASVYMRGIEAIYVPTTLLAQVDAAIGGKTAIDAAGIRNLVGTVQQPRHVMISTALLRSLPARERCSGFVESLKMGIANSEKLAAAVEVASPLMIEGEIPENIDEVVRLSVETKLAVVERDAFDASVRLSLNFGHTFGHALEAVEPDRHTHGAAVAFGIAAATHAAHDLGIITDARRTQLIQLVTPFASAVGVEHDVEAIATAMFTDKKRTASGLRLVLPVESTGVVIHETNDRELLVRAMTATIEGLADN